MDIIKQCWSFITKLEIQMIWLRLKWIWTNNKSAVFPLQNPDTFIVMNGQNQELTRAVDSVRATEPNSIVRLLSLIKQNGFDSFMQIRSGCHMKKKTSSLSVVFMTIRGFEIKKDEKRTAFIISLCYAFVSPLRSHLNSVLIIIWSSP